MLRFVGIQLIVNDVASIKIRKTYSNIVQATWGYPQNGWFTRENPMKIDDLGVSYFRKPPYCRCWLAQGMVCNSATPIKPPCYRMLTLLADLGQLFGLSIGISNIFTQIICGYPVVNGGSCSERLGYSYSLLNGEPFGATQSFPTIQQVVKNQLN